MAKSSSHERHHAYPVYHVFNKSSEHSVLSINDFITALLSHMYTGTLITR